MKKFILIAARVKNDELIRTGFLALFAILILSSKVNGQSPCPGTGYCETNLYSSGWVLGDYINNFSFNTIVNNNSGANSNPPTSSYCTGMSTIVNAGSAYTISMQSGPAWSEGFGVWIDYNHNSSFGDPGEFVYASPNYSTATFTGSVTIPTTALPGLTRLRVRCNYNATISANESCTTFIDGETEDYGVDICFATSAPAVPGPVAGQIVPCANTTSSYSITPVTGASIYNWTPPAGALIGTGQGTNSVTINWGITGGNLTVDAGNCFGTSAVQTLSVTVSAAAPAAPGSISGSSTACAGTTGVYTITPVSEASSYTWTAPAGSAVSSGQGTPSANITLGSASGNITVTASNGCGASPAATMSVTVTTASVDLGPDTMVCIYTPSFVINAGSFSDYQWHDNSTSATFTVDPAALGIGLDTMYVTVTNADGCTDVDSIVFDVSPCLGSPEEESIHVDVFPNPTNGIINIIINNYLQSELEFVITNITGQIVLEKKITNSAGVYSGQLDITMLDKGVYFLQITENNIRIVKKILIN